MLLLACTLPVLAQAPPDRELGFDAQDSSAAFRVRLVWLQTVSGRFDDVEGRVLIDPEGRRVRVQASIRVNSVRVHPAHYRPRLLGKHFFDAARYPRIRFESSPMSLQALRDGRHLKGTLTLHGISHPLTLQLSNTNCPGPALAGCTLRLKGWLNRTQYGMRSYRAFVSPRVRLDLSIRLRPATPPIPPAPRPAASG